MRKAEDLVRRLAGKRSDNGIPASLRGNPEATVLYNNLGAVPATVFKYPTLDEDKAALALRLDWVVRENAPADWRGDDARERQILNKLYPELARDGEATQAIFEIVKHQPGYRWLKRADRRHLHRRRAQGRQKRAPVRAPATRPG